MAIKDTHDQGLVQQPSLEVTTSLGDGQLVQGAPSQVGLLWCCCHWVLPPGLVRVAGKDMGMTYFDCLHIQYLHKQDLKEDSSSILVE